MTHTTRAQLPLTELQRETIEVMRAFRHQHGRWATSTELCLAFGVTKRTMRERLLAIGERGAVFQPEPGKPWQIVEDKPQAGSEAS
ncbi:MAG: hypothetical protein U0836_16125 [Pirellulales bacterium]